MQNAVQISTPRLRACLQGGGGPQVGEVTRLGGVTRLSAQSLILIRSRLHDRWGDHLRDHMDRWGTPPNRVTSPTWGRPPPCKKALRPAFRPHETSESAHRNCSPNWFKALSTQSNMRFQR